MLESDGVCGHSLFGSHAVEIDYDRMEIVLHTTGLARPDSTWTELPLTFKENRIPWTELSASIGGADVETLSCYIDLASSETVEFLTRDGMKFTLPDSLEDVYLGPGPERRHPGAARPHRLGGVGSASRERP